MCLVVPVAITCPSDINDVTYSTVLYTQHREYLDEALVRCITGYCFNTTNTNISSAVCGESNYSNTQGEWADLGPCTRKSTHLYFFSFFLQTLK